ncbi:MAG: hypothetical protein U5L96_19815 [Owenweeksia sp.]|nr:hypothetical protein [Owenweeksia sp.]
MIPLMVKEQYTKNLGRPATLTLQNGQQQSGTITEYDGQAVTLKWKERVPKEKGKGKHTVERENEF